VIIDRVIALGSRTRQLRGRLGTTLGALPEAARSGTPSESTAPAPTPPRLHSGAQACDPSATVARRMLPPP
jgi:hypothetical protein